MAYSGPPRVAVTGANRGIGRGIVAALARSGAHVLIHARTQTGAEETADEARRLGAGAVATVVGDLRDAELPQRTVAAADGAFGGLDAAVLNAAVLGPMTALCDYDDGTFDEVMAINVNAQYALTRALLPGMRRRGSGALVYLTSGLGRFALPGYGVYTVSKHAIEGLAKQVAADYGDEGIVSVAVAPGMVQTEMLRAAIGQQDVSAHVTTEAAGAGFARLVVALLGAEGSKLNGKSLDIDRWL